MDSLLENLEMGAREVRIVYLLTYSQADVTKVPSRQKFADYVLESFHFRRTSNELVVQQ